MTARERKALAKAIDKAADNGGGMVQLYDAVRIGVRWAPGKPEWHTAQVPETLARRLGVSAELAALGYEAA